VAAQLLYERGDIDRVVIVAPASVRAVWFDPELGELKKHLWDSTPSVINEFHNKIRQWKHGPDAPNPLRWVITNYDFIRSANRLVQLRGVCNSKTLLVLDESSAVKSHKSKQTKACLQLRRACGRVVLLNGTPIANNPLDLYSQARLMNPGILDVDTWTNFRARYAVIAGGYGYPKITGWQNLGELQEKLKPYVLRRLKVDCLDLPKKLPSVALSVALTDETWAKYKEMRDELVAWLDTNTLSVALHAAVKAMRLAQICAGFLSGIRELEQNLEPMPDALRETSLFDEIDERPDYLCNTLNSVQRTLPLVGDGQPVDGAASLQRDGDVIEVGSEKLDFFMGWLEERLEEDTNLKLLVWCRFRPELARLMTALRKRGGLQLGEIRGGQKGDKYKTVNGERVLVQQGERAEALRLLDPRTAPKGPVVVGGTPASGSMGLNLTAAHTVIYLSNDFRLLTRLQSEDRVHRPGQIMPVSYFDVIATGPQGQRTVDHLIMKALREKADVANWTASAWIRALREE
jgi:hypothetical protein